MRNKISYNHVFALLMLIALLLMPMIAYADDITLVKDDLAATKTKVNALRAEVQDANDSISTLVTIALIAIALVIICMIVVALMFLKVRGISQIISQATSGEAPSEEQQEENDNAKKDNASLRREVEKMQKGRSQSMPHMVHTPMVESRPAPQRNAMPVQRASPSQVQQPQPQVHQKVAVKPVMQHPASYIERQQKIEALSQQQQVQAQEHPIEQKSSASGKNPEHHKAITSLRSTISHKPIELLRKDKKKKAIDALKRQIKDSNLK